MPHGVKNSLLLLLQATGNAGRVITMGFSTAPTEVNQFLITSKELDVRGSRLQNKMFGKAIDMIKIITTDFAEGQILTGTVVSIKEFGAFLEFAPGKEGMVHISKISKERINRVEDVLTLGDKVKVVCLGKDKMGRISFSMKDVPAEA